MPALFPPAPETNGAASALPTAAWSRELINAMRWVFTVGLLIQQDLPDIEPAPLPGRSAANPAQDMDRAIALRHFEVDANGRTPAGIERFAAIIAEVERKPELILALRGTAVLTVADGDFPDTAPLPDADVQRFFRRLFDAVPHLLYYLSDVDLHAAVAEVVAADAPDDLIERRDGLLSIGLTATSLAALHDRLREAVVFARRQGQPPAVVLRHLKSFPDDIRTALERALSAEPQD